MCPLSVVPAGRGTRSDALISHEEGAAKRELGGDRQTSIAAQTAPNKSSESPERRRARSPTLPIAGSVHGAVTSCSSCWPPCITLDAALGAGVSGGWAPWGTNKWQACSLCGDTGRRAARLSPLVSPLGLALGASLENKGSRVKVPLWPHPPLSLCVCTLHSPLTPVWLELCPPTAPPCPKLTPRASDCDLIWRGLHTGDKFK